MSCARRHTLLSCVGCLLFAVISIFSTWCAIKWCRNVKSVPSAKPASRFPAGLSGIDYARVAPLTQAILPIVILRFCFYLIRLTNRSKLIIPVIFSNLFISQTCVVAKTLLTSFFISKKYNGFRWWRDICTYVRNILLLDGIILPFFHTYIHISGHCEYRYSKSVTIHILT